MQKKRKNTVRRMQKKNEGIPAYITQKFSKKDGLSFNRRRKKFDVIEWSKVVAFVVEILLVIALAFFLVRSFGICTVMIGNSMEDSIYDGDKILINRLTVDWFSLSSGDVVVFAPRGNVDASLSVKRVIGVPNDKVRIENGVIYVNDKQYNETKAMDYIYDAGLAEKEITLGEDEYFVLGDNVSYSQDSRHESIGNVKKSEIKGKIWWNLTHFGLIY